MFFFFTSNGECSKACYHCTEPHDPNQCPYKSYQCHICKKVGHIAKACRKRRTDYKTGNVKLVSTTDDRDEEDNEFDLYTIKEPSKQSGVLLNMEIAGTPIQMELDTGAAVTIMSETAFNEKLQGLRLSPSTVKLRTYVGNCISVLGQATVPVKYKDQQYQLPLYVVSGNKPTLLGRQWLEKIKLDWNSIFKVEKNTEKQPTVDELLSQHKKVFLEEGKPIKDIMSWVDIPENTTPIYFKPRPVPYALRNKVEQELKRLQDAGVISKVEQSDWASPIVVVPKPDGNIRLCGDYKVSVNKVLTETHHTLPIVEDLFATVTLGWF